MSFFPNAALDFVLEITHSIKTVTGSAKDCAGTLVLTGEGKKCANARRALEPLQVIHLSL